MELISKGVRFLQTHGVGATCRAALRRFGVPLKNGGGVERALPYSFAFEPVRYRHTSAPPAVRPGPESLNWVIPNFYGASGGHRTIFRLSQGLEEAGYEVRFYVFGETHYVSDSEATEAMRRHYFPLRATVHLGVTEMRPVDVCLASSWETAYAVRWFDACRRKIYFVQDFEPSFFPASAEMMLAEDTYRFGFECFCAGPWLAQRMREYGNRAESFDLAYDPSIYFAGPSPGAKKRVAFYARHETRRRGTELGLSALALLKRRLPDTEIVLFGSADLPYELPFEYTSAGVLSERELAELYRGATVGLSISLTNYSLVPQEMLACGLPLVEMNLPAVCAAYKDAGPAGVRLAPPTPAGIADALAEVLALPEAEMRREREGASRLVSRLRWSEAERALVEFLGKKDFHRGGAPGIGLRTTPRDVISPGGEDVGRFTS